jgi:hypothetical protein
MRFKNNTLKKILFTTLGFCISNFAYAQVAVKNNTTGSSGAEKLNIEQFYEKAINSNPTPAPINCLKGYELNSFGFCEKNNRPLTNKDAEKNNGIDTLSSSKKRSIGAALIKKHKTEIIQRCGLEESADTKITGMEENKKDPSIVYFPPWRPMWKINYKIDTGNIVFGEKQFINKTCVIDKLDGTVTWEN